MSLHLQDMRGSYLFLKTKYPMGMITDGRRGIMASVFIQSVTNDYHYLLLLKQNKSPSTYRPGLFSRSSLPDNIPLNNTPALIYPELLDNTPIIQPVSSRRSLCRC